MPTTYRGPRPGPASARSIRGILALTSALLISLLAATSTSAMSGGSERDAIAKAALTYAQGFDQLLVSDPAEAEKLGVDSATLATLRVAFVVPVHQVNRAFLDRGDARRVDQAMIDTDLWWVILSADADARLVVSVQWVVGTSAPEAVGLNWVGAHELAAALAGGKVPEPIVVWIPEDLPIVISGPPGSQLVTPVAARSWLEQLGISAEPTAIDDYSRALHGRLAAHQGEPANEVDGLGGGSTTSGAAASPPGSTDPLVGLVGMAVALALIAGVSLVVRTGRPWRHVMRR